MKPEEPKRPDPEAFLRGTTSRSPIRSAVSCRPCVSTRPTTTSIPRVSRETGIPATDLEALVARNTSGRFLGIYGESRVNVLALNLEIDKRLGHPQIAPTPTPTPVPSPAGVAAR